MISKSKYWLVLIIIGFSIWNSGVSFSTNCPSDLEEILADLFGDPKNYTEYEKERILPLSSLDWIPLKEGMEINFNEIIVTGRDSKVTFKVGKDALLEFDFEVPYSEFSDESHIYFEITSRCIYIRRYYPFYKSEKGVGIVTEVRGNALISKDHDAIRSLIVKPSWLFDFQKRELASEKTISKMPFIGISLEKTGISEVGEIEQLRVKKVHPRTSAERAGVQVGDIILSFNDIRIKNHAHIKELIQGCEEGEKVSLKVLRDKKVIEIPVEVEIVTIYK